jgi:predicted transcriptional regulator
VVAKHLKHKIVEAVASLPDDATVEDAIERLYVLAKIERGLAQSDTGETLSHEDVKSRFTHQ